MSLQTIRKTQPNSSKNTGLEQVGDVALGKNTGIVSANLDIDSYKSKLESNKRKWLLKRYAEKLMPTHRTNFCMRQIGMNSESVDLYYNPDTDNAHYQGLAHCDNVWTCPVCSATISARRVAEIQHAVNQWHGSTVMLTYTMRHTAEDDPMILVDQLRNALRYMYKDRAGRNLKEYVGWHGTITNLDVTYHKRNGFHIHIHQLVFLDPEKSKIDVMNDENIQRYIEFKFAPRWITMLERNGASANIENGFKCTAGEQFNREYVAKFGRLPKDTSWTIANEVGQGNAKRGSAKIGVDKGLHPFQILEKTSGRVSSRWARIWSQFVNFTYRRNQLTWSPNLKKYFGIDDLSEEQVIEEVENQTDGKHLILSMNYGLWDNILRFELRCQLLNDCIQYQGEKYELEQLFINLKNRLQQEREKADRGGGKFDATGTVWDYKANKIRMDGVEYESVED